MNRVTRNAFLALLLTSVHHAYGAYAYSTPWRLHVVIVSTLTAVAMAGLLVVLRRHPGGLVGAIAFWGLAAVTLAMPVALIGVFEGLYNHAVKDILYASGTSLATMRRLFPPPTYELPNDVFFEATGILQIGPAIAAGYHLYCLIRDRLHTYWSAADAPVTAPRQSAVNLGR